MSHRATYSCHDSVVSDRFEENLEYTFPCASHSVKNLSKAEEKVRKYSNFLISVLEDRITEKEAAYRERPSSNLGRHVESLKQKLHDLEKEKDDRIDLLEGVENEIHALEEELNAQINDMKEGMSRAAYRVCLPAITERMNGDIERLREQFGREMSFKW